MSKANVIDMTKRRKAQLSGAGESEHHLSNVAPVLDISQMRKNVIREERRQVKRTILAEFIGAFILIPQQGLQKVQIYDISDDGLSMDVPFELGHFLMGEEFAMRLYLSKDTYLPFTVRVTNFREISDEGVYRHGVQFIKETTNQEALKHFVKFLETVTASLQTDRGDVLVSKIK